jgi:hypothetical protein
MNTDWPWWAVAGLGAWHGLNPAMGWLFAVGLAFQRRSRRALFEALLPIALGHAVAIASVLALLLLLGVAIPLFWLQCGGAVALLGVGLWTIFRRRHPTWVGMKVGFWDLATWSWIMATAHGAGLMIVPVLLRPGVCGTDNLFGTNRLLFSFWPAVGLEAVVIHTLSHLIVAGIIGSLVYDFIGLTILRRAWVNVDLIWSASLIVGGLFLIW